MIKIGLIGCGFMGSMHSACYSVIEGVEVVAVADVRPEKAAEIAKNHPGCKIYSTGMELIENEKVDAVDICLPTFLHAEHAIAAMRAGMNVFVEKPVARTLAEGEEMIRVEKETGKMVQVGLVIRSWNEYMWLKENYDAGKFGKILCANFTRLSSRPTWGWESWLDNPDRSGTAALDLHIHDVDFVRYLMGEPTGLYSRAGRNADGLLEHISTVFDYNGAAVTVEGGWGYPAAFPFTAVFRVVCEKCVVVLGGDGLHVYWNDGTDEKVEVKEEFQGNNNAGGNLSSLGGYYNELKYFVGCLTTGSKNTRAPLDDSVKSLALVLNEIELAGGCKI